MQEKFNQQSNIFSERLKCALESYPQSKGFLAQKVGVSPVTISRWLNGRVPDHRYQVLLADELSVRFNWLILGEGSMREANAETSMLSEDITRYRAEYKPDPRYIQPVAEAAQNSDAKTLWHQFAETAEGMAKLNSPEMRLKIFEDLLTMAMEAKRQDEETVRLKKQ